MTAIPAKKSRTEVRIMSGVDVPIIGAGIQQPMAWKTLHFEWEDDEKRWKMGP